MNVVRGTVMRTEKRVPRVVTGLVTRARHGDQQAWDSLVEAYAPLVWSICRRYRLSRADADDVGQTVWLRLVTRLDQVRDPAALAGWIATTTGRECGKVRRATRPAQTASWELDTGNIPDPAAEPADSGLLAAERHAALRQAFTCLPPDCQQLLALLIEDPPVPYAQISARLGIPVGSIGPSRRRCLQKLRHHPALAALITAHAEIPEPEPSSQPAARC
jgi:RNA polymerase sigma factor (sigma-70 family)